MTDTVLRDFDKPDWNPTADTIRRLEAVVPREFEGGADTVAEEEQPAETHRQPPADEAAA